MVELETPKTKPLEGAASTVRRRYSTPKLVSFGTLREITRLGNEVGPPDGLFLSGDDA